MNQNVGRRSFLKMSTAAAGTALAAQACPRAQPRTRPAPDGLCGWASLAWAAAALRS